MVGDGAASGLHWMVTLPRTAPKMSGLSGFLLKFGLNAKKGKYLMSHLMHCK